MKIIRKLRGVFLPYERSIIDITGYQLVIGLVTSLTVFLLRQLAMLLIRSTGRVAVSTGDLEFLYKTWQGPFLIIIGIAILFVYVAFDINTQIIYASGYLSGKADLHSSIKEGFLSIRDLLTPDGLFIVLYIALIVPIVGFGFTISLTRGLYIPDFIFSVIHSVPLYRFLYYLFVLVFLAIGIINIFTLHGILISRLRSYDADNESRRLFRNNWKDFILTNLRFFLRCLLSFFLLILLCGILPAALTGLLVEDPLKLRTALIFVGISLIVVLLLMSNYFKSFWLIRITELYYHYKDLPITPAQKVSKKKIVAAFLAIITVLSFIFFGSYLLANHFDEIFSDQISTGIIAHRVGGSEAPENALIGIDKAVEYGAYGCETDVQRTADGHYIINHDGTFERLCGVNAKPEELTLEQIRELTIIDPLFPDSPQNVATIEEMLEASRDRIILFIELKGNTADYQMAEDIVSIVKEKKMMEQCVIISLKYDLIDYIERKYPEMATGYLTFASFGNTQDLNCDYIGLEEEAATRTAIDAIHSNNKKVLIWTPNKEASQTHFLLSDADYIITDNISQASELIKSLSGQAGIQTLLDMIVYP